MERIELSTIKDELAELDELTLLDLLDISSADIVDRFEDFIIDNYEKAKQSVRPTGEASYTEDSW